ncbi:MAG: hypothetical protein B7X59_14440 [Polaromonas sp. 39-63-203]|nr:MAG: hypothetical protein B7X59_14440 [Polaromonas sp. 39-63-203]
MGASGALGAGVGVGAGGVGAGGGGGGGGGGSTARGAACCGTLDHNSASNDVVWSLRFQLTPHVNAASSSR